MGEKVIRALQKWEKAVSDNEESFLNRFCKGGTDLVNVSWDSENIRVVYILDSGQHVSNSFKISEWFDFLSQARREAGRDVITPPRYDDVFFEGLERLDRKIPAWAFTTRLR